MWLGAFTSETKTHPGISPFQMFLEGHMRFSRLKKRIPDALFHAHTRISNASRRVGTAPMRFSGLKKRIRAFLHFKCFLKGGSCPDAFFQAQKTHPGISPFQMLLEGWELPRCVFSKFRECILSRVIRIIIKFVECIL